MKTVIAIVIILAGVTTQACDHLSQAQHDLNAVNSVFQKATTLVRSQHPDSSIVKMELKIRSSNPEVLHYLTVLKNEENQTCNAYYISATLDNQCQSTAQVGAQLNIGDQCLSL